MKWNGAISLEMDLLLVGGHRNKLRNQGDTFHKATKIPELKEETKKNKDKWEKWKQ